MFLLLVILLVIATGSGLWAEEKSDSTGLERTLGFKAKDLTGTTAYGIDFGLAFMFPLWGMNGELGLDTLEWLFIPDHELNADIYYIFSKSIGKSPISYFSAGEYAFEFLGEFNYSAYFGLGLALDLKDVTLASLQINWIYARDGVFGFFFDAVFGVGYQFYFGRAGDFLLWADTYLGLHDTFGISLVEGTAQYTFYITDKILLRAGALFELFPMQDFSYELSASLSAGVTL
jgi:hypothetical protein